MRLYVSAALCSEQKRGRRGNTAPLALGSDYDGTDVPSWLDPARKVEDLYQLVCGAFGQALANRLFFENALDFMKRYELAGEG